MCFALCVEPRPAIRPALRPPLGTAGWCFLRLPLGPCPTPLPPPSDTCGHPDSFLASWPRGSDVTSALLSAFPSSLSRLFHLFLQSYLAHNCQINLRTPFSLLPGPVYRAVSHLSHELKSTLSLEFKTNATVPSEPRALCSPRRLSAAVGPLGVVPCLVLLVPSCAHSTFARAFLSASDALTPLL